MRKERVQKITLPPEINEVWFFVAQQVDKGLTLQGRKRYLYLEKDQIKSGHNISFVAIFVWIY